MLLAMGNIIIRAFYRPFGATYEVISFLSTIVFAFALGASQIKKVHVTVDLLIDKLPQQVRKTLEILVCLLSVALFSTITWQMLLYAGRLHQRSHVSDALMVPISPLVYSLAFGFAFISFVLIVDLFKLLRSDDK